MTTPHPAAAAGSFMTREQAIEFCRKRRPGVEPTEQHIAATIDAYSALFGDMVPADFSDKSALVQFIRSQACGGDNFNRAVEYVAEQVERWLGRLEAEHPDITDLKPKTPEEHRQWREDAARDLGRGQAAPAGQEDWTDERIDSIAELVVKGMQDGIRGFCRVWGWQQFARALIDVCKLPSPQPTSAAGQPLSEAAHDVLAERQRQVSAEGWTPEHDDEHTLGELAIAAACLVVHGTDAQVFDDGSPCDVWGLAKKHAADHRRQLVIAGALILAEIERLDRAAPKESA